DEEVSLSPKEWFSRVHFQDLSGLRRALAQHLEQGSEAFEFDYRIRAKDGHYRWMAARGIAVRDARGKPIRMAGSQSDVTEKKTTDPLTRLPNRVLFTERVEAALRRRQQDAASGFAVFFLDLDRFKLVNDSFGHLAGDQLLVEFSQRMCDAMPDSVPDGPESAAKGPGLASLVARLSGDEFAILIEGITEASAASA